MCDTSEMQLLIFRGVTQLTHILQDLHIISKAFDRMPLNILAKFIKNDIDACITMLFTQDSVYRLIDGNNFIVD